MQLRSGRVVESQTRVKAEPVRTETIVMNEVRAETTIKAEIKIENTNISATEISYQPAIIYHEDKHTFLLGAFRQYLKNVQFYKNCFLKMNEVIKLYELLNNHYDFINSNKSFRLCNISKIAYDKVLDLEKEFGIINTENITEKAIKELLKSTIETFKNKYEKSI